MVNAAGVEMYINQIFTLMSGLDYSMKPVVHINKLKCLIVGTGTYKH